MRTCFICKLSYNTAHRSYCERCRKQKQHEHKKNNIAKHLWSIAKSRAKKVGIEFTISVDDIAVPERCPVTGHEWTFGGMEDRLWHPSLDRLDSSRGYIPGNVAVMSFRANRIKSNCTIEELENMLRLMREAQSKEK